ncbi:MAG: ATPase, T2SS/T4P/T4SS family, partial [Nitrospirae bacterium]|nr:ATPase, T2SS/T4P/T4SS family [Nitrospirota bacterium]
MFSPNWDEAGVGVADLGDLKHQLHRKVIEALDLTVVAKLDPDLLKNELSNLVEHLLEEESAPLNIREREELISQIQNEVMGLGPLEPLVQDPTIDDILVNRCDQIYVERAGKLELTDVRFRNEAHLRKVIEKIVTGVGRRIDESSPMCDCRLQDGSRVNAIIPPLALDGSSLSIRKFSKDKLQIEDLVNKRSLTPEIAELLQGIVKARLNVIISGGTGSGKTTILNILSGF